MLLLQFAVDGAEWVTVWRKLVLRGTTVHPIDCVNISVEESLMTRVATQDENTSSVMCISNSIIDFASSDGETIGGETDDVEAWSVRSETNSTVIGAAASLEATRAVGATSASSVGHSPRRHQIWFTSTTAAGKGGRNPQEDLKVR